MAGEQQQQSSQSGQQQSSQGGQQQSAQGGQQQSSQGGQQQQAQQQQQQAAAFDWKTAGGVSDDTQLGYVQNKGWKGPADLLNSYSNLEKLHGAPERLVQLPRDESDANGWTAVYDRLGRPKDANGYELTKLVPQGQDTKFAETAAGWFHEQGLNPRQAQGLVAKWNELNATLTTQHAETTKAAHAAEVVKLKSDWGANYEANAQMVDRAAQVFGLDGPKLDALRAAMGPGETMRFLHNLGQRLGTEGAFIAPAGDNGFRGMSPEAAKAKLAELKGDKDWIGKFLNGDTKARSESEALHRIAHPA